MVATGSEERRRYLAAAGCVVVIDATGIGTATSIASYTRSDDTTQPVGIISATFLGEIQDQLWAEADAAKAAEQIAALLAVMECLSGALPSVPDAPAALAPAGIWITPEAKARGPPDVYRSAQWLRTIGAFATHNRPQSGVREGVGLRVIWIESEYAMNGKTATDAGKMLGIAVGIWLLLMFAADRVWENHLDNQQFEREQERSARLDEHLQDSRDARRSEFLESIR